MVTFYSCRVTAVFFQFEIRKENDLTKLYVKENELKDEFAFSTGIKLLNKVPSRVVMDVSPFRRDSGYSEVYYSVFSKYIPSLSTKMTEEKIKEIKRLWDQRIQFLINLDEKEFTPFNLHQLKPHVAHKSRENVLQPVDDDYTRKNLLATFYPIEFASLSALDLKRDTSLNVYTASKKSRPWTGLLIKVSEDKSSVSIQWAKKVKHEYLLHDYDDEKPYISSVPFESIIFTDGLQNMSQDGNRNGPYKLDDMMKKEIMSAYRDRDENIN